MNKDLFANSGIRKGCVEMRKKVRSAGRWIFHPIRELGHKRRDEAACLRRQIHRKAFRLVANTDQLNCFLAYRFEEPLVRHGKRGPLYGRAFTFLSIAAIGAGVASSALATNENAPSSVRWIIFALGLVVAVTTAINQLWKPAQRSVGAYRAGNALRREGWDYVNLRGRYQGVRKDREAFDLFLDQIREIQSQVDSIDEVQAEISGTSDGS